MYYAYIRVSTDHQHVENQKHEILSSRKNTELRLIHGALKPFLLVNR